MSGITGIELSPDASVLVRTGRRGARTTVAAARAIAPAEWLDDREGLTGALRKARRAHRMPNRARVVVWGAFGSESALEAAPLSEIRPVLTAGFEIDAILTPVEALVEMVRAREVDTSTNAIAAVALNCRGAAIAIVSRGELIASRSFEWPLGPAFRRSRAELLERYLLVAQLAPELQHLIELVRPVHGARVASVLLCGTLPDLRSLSMLLIEELDVDVESLDSPDLLEPNLSGFAESVAVLQLASAAATEQMAGAIPGKVPVTRGGVTLSILALALAGAWAYPQLARTARALPVLTSEQAAVLSADPAETLTAVVPELKTEATMGRIGGRTAVPSSAPRAADQEVPAATGATSPPPAPVAAARESPVLPPLPRVDGIMISGERRLAIVGGSIVAAGDRVGQRSVVRIERDGVVLREPSGQEVLVAIRTRKTAPGGTEGPRQP